MIVRFALYELKVEKFLKLKVESRKLKVPAARKLYNFITFNFLTNTLGGRV